MLGTGPAGAASSNVRVTPLIAALLPASDIKNVLCPAGPASRMSMSRVKVCVTPRNVAVTFATVPVTPVIALAGNGAIDVHGVPKGCLVTSYRELDYIMTSYGERIAARTVNKLFSVARHPVTWQNTGSDAQVEAYKWYSPDAVTDKRTPQG